MIGWVIAGLFYVAGIGMAVIADGAMKPLPKRWMNWIYLVFWWVYGISGFIGWLFGDLIKRWLKK